MKKKLFAVFVIFLSLSAVFLLSVFFLPYPRLSEFQNRPVSTRIYDSEGQLIQVTALENGISREYVPLGEIPEKLQFYFLQSEDRNFYRHCGIDFSAILRAIFQNASEMRTVSGASTITMQLARIIKPNRKRNLLSKILETYDALRLEARLTKSEILELYLNSVPFGFNTEGVATASKTFFAKNISSLSEEEMVCLSVIPRRPSLYNPLTNPENCAKSAFELYSSLQNSPKTREFTLSDFEKTARKAESFSYPFEFPHFVRHFFSSENKNAFLPEIHTTLNIRLQHAAEDLLASSVEQYSQNRLSNGAILIFETKTGSILSWVGSADFFDERHNGQVDGVLSVEQPGSAMKPFLYALALENGFSPSSVLPDVPMEFGFENLYVPQNFNNRFNGPVRFRVALASSLNIPAVYILNELGIDKYLKKLSSLGFQSLENKTPGLSLALGSEEISLLELTRAFSVFARDGVFIPLNFTPDSSGSSDSQRTPVYDINTARIIADILSDKEGRALGFGYSQMFATDFPAIFKTGTANQYQTITAVGATPSYTVGVWMGNFSGETVIGKTGSSIPAKIAKDLLVLLQGNKNEEFKTPPQFKKEKICALSGLCASENCPDTVQEYVSGEKKTCDWHTQNSILFPKEYSTWFRLKNRKGSMNDTGEKLKIVSPRNGSVFYYDPSIPAGQQKLIIEANGGSEKTVRFFSDGKFLEEKERPFTVQLELKRGKHTVEAICGEDKDRIEILVK